MKAIVFGAGNIGRGFIGQLLFQSGYEITFADIDERLLALLNEQRGYTVRLVERRLTVPLRISGVSAIHSGDADAVARAVAGADVAVTAVGVRALPHIAEPLARGIALRSGKPLNIIICENMRHAGEFLRDRVAERMSGRKPESTGFVEACIGRMVPAPRPGDDPMVLRAEPYDWLPVDADSIAHPLPPIRRMWPIPDFDRYVRRKLYIHNMGHAVCAWLGALSGYAYIYEAIADKAVASVCRSAMLEAAAALAARYPSLGLPALTAHADDILHRFGNEALADPIDRVGRDTERKLGPDDRIAGALELCREQGIPCPSILTGLAAGLLFDGDDPGTSRVRTLVETEGVPATLARIAGVTDPDTAGAIADRVDRLRRTGLRNACQFVGTTMDCVSN
jgi:mannitol-1-phosphate 5-dehydrogenase